MKRTDLIIRSAAVLLFAALSVLFVPQCAHGQSVALGERTPRLECRHWLGGHRPPQCEYTYIGFVHSGSESCKQTIGRVAGYAAATDDFGVVILTRESRESVGGWLFGHAAGRSGVSYANDEMFSEFGVNYAPFGVIVDRRRRALWFGNPSSLDSQILTGLIDSDRSRRHHRHARRRESGRQTAREDKNN